MIDNGLSVMKFYLNKNRDEIKKNIELVIDVAKISAILFVGIALYIIIVYMNSVGAPLPVSDLSTAQLLVIIALTITVCICVLILSIYAPIYMSSASKRDRRHIRRMDYDYSLRGRRWVEHLGSQKLLFQGGALAILPTYATLCMSRAGLLTAIIWIVMAVLFGSSVSTYIFYHYGIITNKTARFKSKLCAIVFIGSTFRAVWCLFWLYNLTLLMFVVKILREFQDRSLGRIVIWSAFFSVSFVVYLLLTSVRARLERVPVALFVTTMLLLLIFPSFFGERALHILGIGGSIPVQLVFRTAVPQATGNPSQVASGCLLLNTGNHVVIRPMDTPTADNCAQSQGQAAYNTMHQNVQMFLGTDIIIIKGSPAVVTAHAKP